MTSRDVGRGLQPDTVKQSALMAVALLQLVDGLQRALRGRARGEDRAARLTAHVEELVAAECFFGRRRPSAASPPTNPDPHGKELSSPTVSRVKSSPASSSATRFAWRSPPCFRSTRSPKPISSAKAGRTKRKIALSVAR
jgi:hypothetical protein